MYRESGEVIKMKMGFYKLNKKEMSNRFMRDNKTRFYKIHVDEVRQYGIGFLLNCGNSCVGFYIVNV